VQICTRKAGRPRQSGPRGEGKQEKQYRHASTGAYRRWRSTRPPTLVPSCDSEMGLTVTWVEGRGYCQFATAGYLACWFSKWCPASLDCIARQKDRGKHKCPRRAQLVLAHDVQTTTASSTVAAVRKRQRKTDSITKGVKSATRAYNWLEALALALSLRLAARFSLALLPPEGTDGVPIRVESRVLVTTERGDGVAGLTGLRPHPSRHRRPLRRARRAPRRRRWKHQRQYWRLRPLLSP